MTANSTQWQVGDRVVWPHREGIGRARRTVYSTGTVTAVDLPGMPAGAQVTFDRPVNGAPTCYATYAELHEVDRMPPR